MGEGTGFLTYCGGLVVLMIFWWTVSSHFPAHLTLDKFSVHTKTLQAGCGQLKECTAILCWLICTADTSLMSWQAKHLYAHHSAPVGQALINQAGKGSSPLLPGTAWSLLLPSSDCLFFKLGSHTFLVSILFPLLTASTAS